jgi:ferritin-like metal-binding protein YciE
MITCMITCVSNALCAGEHNRMPVVLDPANYPAWPGETPAEQIDWLDVQVCLNCTPTRRRDMDTTSKSERLLQWLRDAHGMEQQAETMLTSQASRLEHYPELRRRIEQHITETQNQRRRLEDCIRNLGSDTSTLKDAAGKLTAMMQGLAGVFAGDEVVKGAMAGYTFEHFEISSYTALIATAEAAADEQTATLCRDILKEEQAMADWLRDHLPVVTQQYLEREAAGAPAKR